MYIRKNYLSVNDSDIFYRCQNFKFYFSSVKRRETFIKNLDSFIKDENIKFINKYNVIIEDFEILLLFSLYQKVEDKGIKIEQLIDNKIIKRTYKEIPTFKIYGFGGED